MRIVFMGTPDFAVPSLQALIDAGHDVCAVYTQPDKPQGRKQILTAPPVKTLALEHDIPVFQPNTLKNEDEQARLRELAPEVIIVVAYGKLLAQGGTRYPAARLHQRAWFTAAALARRRSDPVGGYRGR